MSASQLRLHRLHLRHRGVGFVGEREEDDLHQHGHQQDGDAEIADQVEEPVERQEHRLGDEIEPAPVDQKIEVVEAELLVVAAEAGAGKVDADHAGFLGAGEQPRIGAAGAADRDGLRIQQIVGLVGPDGADQVGREPRLQLRIGVRQQRRGPVFVGDAEPAVGDLEVLDLVFVDLRVAVFLQALVAEIADQAFMQDVVALDLRGAVPRDQRERIQRHRRGADIGDVILDGEEVTLVDRDGAAEGEAVAIVVFQRHRAVGREAAGAFLLPQRVLVGQPHGRARGRDPAEFGVIGRRRARGREQHDRRRFGIDGLAELDQRQIVDARALQRNAAGDASGFRS